MNIKAFFVAALSSALDQGIATADDLLRHVTTDVLSNQLPRPLWSRLLTACLGASRVDAALVVETVGIPNLCEHISAPIIWACLSEIGQRSLGDQVVMLERRSTTVAPPSSAAASSSSSSGAFGSKPAISLPTPPPTVTATPPAPPPAMLGPSIPAPSSGPLADLVADLEIEPDRVSSPTRARTPTGQRFRSTNTGIGRLAANNTRRPQAIAATPEPPPAARARRGQTEAEGTEIETEVREDWKTALAVEDEQLVDWQSTEEATVTGEEFSNRKR